MKNNRSRENVWISLLVTVLIPSLILSKMSGVLTELYAFILALSFPFLYGLYEMWVQKKVSFFSVLGVVSVGLTGGVGLLHLPVEYLAVKEALIPGLLGIAVIISLWTPFPVMKSFLEQGFAFDRVEQQMKGEKQKEIQKIFDRSTLMLGGSFLLSSVLNYVVAKWIVTSPAGTTAFNEELGRMTLISYPVIVVPSFLILMIMAYYLLSRLSKITGLEMDELLKKR